MIPKGTLLSYGWREVKSMAQADQLVRRELKQRRSRDQRAGVRLSPDYEFMLAIKPGVWFKFKRLHCGDKKLLLWRQGR